MTLAKRIGAYHLHGRIRSSTFRLTLASVLRNPVALLVVGPKQLDRDSWQRLSEWLNGHLRVAVHPFSASDALADLQRQVLSILAPTQPGRDAPNTGTHHALGAPLEACPTD
jgi:hypothetical protein